jgi:hypothetical protein
VKNAARLNRTSSGLYRSRTFVPTTSAIFMKEGSPPYYNWQNVSFLVCLDLRKAGHSFRIFSYIGGTTYKFRWFTGYLGIICMLTVSTYVGIICMLTVSNYVGIMCILTVGIYPCR